MGAVKIEAMPDPIKVHSDIKKIVRERGLNHPSVQHFKQTYLGAIALAHGWWQEHDLTNSPSAASFKRILDRAIADYKDIFEQE